MSWYIQAGGTKAQVKQAIETEGENMPGPLTNAVLDLLDQFPDSQQVRLETSGSIDSVDGGQAILNISTLGPDISHVQ